MLCSVTQYDTKAFSDFVKYAAAQDRAIEQPQPGESWRLGGASVTVLGPLRDYGDNNENSIVLRIDYGETSFLFTGDIGLEAEDELVESGANLSATVLKVATLDYLPYCFFNILSPLMSILMAATGYKIYRKARGKEKGLKIEPLKDGK